MNRGIRVLLVLAVAAGVYVGVHFALHHFVPLRLHLTIEHTEPASTQIFWNLGSGYSEENSSKSPRLPPGVHELEFVIPPDVSILRVDPRSGAGAIRIHEMRLEHLRVAIQWGGSHGFPGWQADHDIGRFVVEDGVLELDASGPDPFLSNPIVGVAVRGTLQTEQWIAMGALGLLVLLVFWRQAFASNRNDPLLVRKSLLPNLGLLIASVLIFGGAGYVFYTKVLRPETPQYFQSDAYMISFLTRDAKRLSSREGKLALVLDPFTFYANYPQQRTNSFYIDVNGFRGGIGDAGKPTVMVFGGSATFGYGLERDEHLLTAFLNKEMQSHTFINAAVVGFVSGQESAQMIHHLDRFRPSAYVLIDGWNEVAEQFDRANYLGVNHQFLAFADRLHQYALLMDKTGIAETSYPVEPLDSGEKNDLDRIVATYLENLERMNTWARARGARFLVLLQPEVTRRGNPSDEEQAIVGHKRYSARHSAEYRKFTERALELCRDREIECYDLNLEPEFQESSETLFLDVVHLSAAGHEVVGKITHRILRTPAESPGRTIVNR